MPFIKSRPQADPYLPSFAFVLEQGDYSLRLPTYRNSYRRRYHPYPRFTVSREVDPLMTTIDHRNSDTYFGLTAAPLYLIDEVEETTINNLRQVLDDGNRVVGGQRRIRRLSTLIIDLALAVQRKLRDTRIAKAILPADTRVEQGPEEGED